MLTKDIVKLVGDKDITHYPMYQIELKNMPIKFYEFIMEKCYSISDVDYQ